MTIRDYLVLIISEPLLLRLSMGAILCALLFATHAVTRRLPRGHTSHHSEPERDRIPEQPREIAGVPHFY